MSSIMNNGVQSDIEKFLYALIAADAFSIICTIGVNSEAGTDAIISEYSILGAAILVLTVLKILKLKQSANSFFTLSTLITLAPFMIILCNIIYYIVVTSIYFKDIVKKDVSNYYYAFSYTSTALILGQIILLIKTLFSTMEDKLPSRIFAWIMFLGTINVISGITLGVILKFYTTQG